MPNTAKPYVVAAHLEHTLDRFSLQSAAVHLILGRDRSCGSIDAAVLLFTITLVYNRPTAGGILQTASGNELDNTAANDLLPPETFFEHMRRKITSG
jgi:hypothetical protein